jgi:hypothetical protein
MLFWLHERGTFWFSYSVAACQAHAGLQQSQYLVVFASKNETSGTEPPLGVAIGVATGVGAGGAGTDGAGVAAPDDS